MPDDNGRGAELAISAFLAAVDARDIQAMEGMLATDAAILHEYQGTALRIDLSSWLDMASSRGGAASPARVALLMVLRDSEAGFKVSTHLGEDTHTDWLLLRRSGNRWRVARITRS